jgi:transcriptional regulator with XRE-family HTH domain
MARRGPGEIDKHVGARVRERRNQVGMSQTDLADALGVTFQQVQKYEKGVNRVGAGRLAEIAQVLGCDLTSFYDGAPRVRAAGPGSERMALARRRSEVAQSPEGTMVIEAMANMRPNMRSAMVKIARALVSSAS